MVAPAPLPACGVSVVFLAHRKDVTSVTRGRCPQRRGASMIDRIAAAIETISDGFALLDAEHRFLLINAKFRQIFGVPDDVLRVGAHYADFVRAVGSCRSGRRPRRLRGGAHGAPGGARRTFPARARRRPFHPRRRLPHRGWRGRLRAHRHHRAGPARAGARRERRAVSAAVRNHLRGGAHPAGRQDHRSQPRPGRAQRLPARRADRDEHARPARPGISRHRPRAHRRSR